MSETPHLLIVESRYYEDVAAELLSGATAELEAAGATSERIEVPGAFEIPAAIRMAIRSMDFYAGRRRYDGYIALGCVIRGETSHYDYICMESARKLQDLAVNYTLALGYGILTCETHDQAMERAAVDRKNKGGDAARACLSMIGVKQRFRLFPR
ncbi:MAG: 6,7-dimethyl-8-ribityllumazine synthase [Kiloniellales bacterium]|nr:6,7-dimethyl-8-ribityllumazine synthase [Kiloniellales bacterium]MDJ0980324.1 6,7-dimethyl-8-ribityllumazine synthase [Kiloniellales bacterium]